MVFGLKKIILNVKIFKRIKNRIVYFMFLLVGFFVYLVVISNCFFIVFIIGVFFSCWFRFC